MYVGSLREYVCYVDRLKDIMCLLVNTGLVVRNVEKKLANARLDLKHAANGGGRGSFLGTHTMGGQ